MHKAIQKIIALTTILSMSACSSTPLSPESSFCTYTAETSQHEGDKITHFMLSEDGKTLIMMGYKNHYSLQINEDINALLKWDAREKIKAYLYDAKSNDGKSISMRYNLYVSDTDATKEDISFLKSHKFSFVSIYKSYVHTGELHGQFYQANAIDLSKFDKFKKDYSLMYSPQKAPCAKYRSTVENTGNTLLFLGAVIVVAPLALIVSPLQLFKESSPSQ